MDNSNERQIPGATPAPAQPQPTAGPLATLAPAQLWRIRLFWWLGVAVFLVFSLWSLGPVLTPFVVGAVIGYLLDPLVSRLERRGVPRPLAAGGLVLSMMCLILGALVILVPLLAVEAAALIRDIPRHYNDLQRLLAQRVPGLSLGETSGAASDAVARMGETLTDASITAFGGIVSGLNGLVRLMLFVVVMPVVAFYLLMDWQRLLGSLRGLVPHANVNTVSLLARDIDAALAGYLRGVALVCAILIVYYASLLSLVGLQYGLLVGVVAGAVSFVPYVGAVVGGALAIGLALYQFSDAPLFIGLVVGIFLVGQVLESQILVPRLVGSSVNLHPVWLIFAVMAFGYLFGLVGAIVAVPVAAAMGVLVRFFVNEYRQSHLFARASTVIAP